MLENSFCWQSPHLLDGLGMRNSLALKLRSELLLLLQEAGCSAEQQCAILPAEPQPEPERGSSSGQ